MDRNVGEENMYQNHFQFILFLNFQFEEWHTHNYFRFIRFYSDEINLSDQLEPFLLMIDSQKLLFYI